MGFTPRPPEYSDPGQSCALDILQARAGGKGRRRRDMRFWEQVDQCRVRVYMCVRVCVWRMPIVGKYFGSSHIWR